MEGRGRFLFGRLHEVMQKQTRQAEVGLVMNGKMGWIEISFYEQFSERILVVEIDMKPKPTILEQVYLAY